MNSPALQFPSSRTHQLTNSSAHKLISSPVPQLPKGHGMAGKHKNLFMQGRGGELRAKGRGRIDNEEWIINN